MSWLSQLFHKQITPQQFGAKVADALKGVIGTAISQNSTAIVTEEQKLKAQVQGQIDAYLTTKFGSAIGGVAAHAADSALSALAAAVEGIVVSHDPAQHTTT